MNESISTAAGAQHGQFLRPVEIRGWIRSAGRVPAERSTVYRVLREFDEEPAELSRLDSAPSGSPFGSYRELTASRAFRFREGPCA